MNEELADIKPLVQMTDFGTIFWYAGALLLFLLLAVLAYFLFQFFFKDGKKKLIAQLSAIDFSDAKKDAYLVTQLLNSIDIEDDNLRQKREALNERLRRYKYKKQIGSVDMQTKREFALFVELLDARI
ncbi:MAG: hypothetical protein ACQESH_05160 [Campylobacterota bacterium]